MAIHWWRSLQSAAVHLVYPPHCPGCGQLAERPYPTDAAEALCPKCLSELWPCQEARCQKCGEGYLSDSSEAFVCQTCEGQRFAFDYASAPYESRGVLRELVHRFKYQRQLFLRPVLGALFVDVLEEPRLQSLGNDWLSVPVPLHPRRFREREFNQALELCRELRAKRQIPFVDALRRTRYTSSQTRYRREQRRANLQGAFVVKPRKLSQIQDRTIALVDDVFTTGSTANECARVLRAAGAKKVVVITLARG